MFSFEILQFPEEKLLSYRLLLPFKIQLDFNGSVLILFNTALNSVSDTDMKESVIYFGN